MDFKKHVERGYFLHKETFSPNHISKWLPNRITNNRWRLQISALFYLAETKGGSTYPAAQCTSFSPTFDFPYFPIANMFVGHMNEMLYINIRFERKAYEATERDFQHQTRFEHLRSTLSSCDAETLENVITKMIHTILHQFDSAIARNSFSQCCCMLFAR